MYCIKCECIPIQKKRRIAAKVYCRNIKNECSKPTCDEPVLFPGRCCKVCPGDFNSPDVMQETPSILTPEEEEKSMKHFATLLTGRTSSMFHREDGSPSVSLHQNNNNYVATGRFTFHRKNLYYSFYVSDPLYRPRALQFSDFEGNILGEQALFIDGVTSVYQNVTGKVCGVWRRVPREYRRLLREERMFVSLLWGTADQEQHILSGQVARYRSLSTELFTSLMQPAPGTDSLTMNGAGGTAIISASSSAPSIHVSIVFNGIFSPEEFADVPIVVRLESLEKQQIVLQEEVKIEKPAHELNTVEVQTAVSSADLRLLTRGKLVVSIASKKKPTELRLEGKVITRATCEIFQGVLSSADADNTNDEDEDSEKSVSAQTVTSGMAWMYMNRDGALVYSVQLDELSLEDSPMLVLVSGHRSGGRRSLLELEDLTPSLSSGWANGTIDRLSPRELEQLYAGELALNVATRLEPSLVRGRLVPRLMADARDSHSPVLLKRPNETVPAALVGMAWLGIDSECSLHFEVMLSGLASEDHSLKLYLKTLPFVVPGAPVFKRLLEEFRGSHLEGFVMGISQNEFLRIDSGVNFLEVHDHVSGSVWLRARLNWISVPLSCLPKYSDNDVPGSTYPQIDSSVPEATKCYHEMQFFDEGAQWRSKQNPCTMCNCHQNLVKCDPVPCPPLTCSSRTAPGECCPSCTNSSASQESNTSVTRGCYLAGQFYPAGKSWHPYLPPSGFELCAVCTCDANTLEVQCPRVQCPPLTCNEHEAFRPDKKACCKQCPIKSEDGKVPMDQQSPNGTLTHRTDVDILASGGCNYPATGEVFENGHEWHPKVHSHGEVKCVLCRCKDGSIKCERKRCLRSSCTPSTSSFTSSRRRNISQSTVTTDDCCPQCRRNRRHHRSSYNS
ncbi:dorsal-ventral patterning protein Sog isoform X2 [Cryptotermes secundus]|nr:dorsal-ventral patterning protein Sog isoform X2 [Cryptotermes secundus]